MAFESLNIIGIYCQIDPLMLFLNIDFSANSQVPSMQPDLGLTILKRGNKKLDMKKFALATVRNVSLTLKV